MFLRKKIKETELAAKIIPSDIQEAISAINIDYKEAVQIKPNNKAKRLCLRTNIKKRQIIVTLPACVYYLQAREFLSSQKNWILEQLQNMYQNRIIIKPNITIPILGSEFQIIKTGKLRGVCYRENKKLYVSSTDEHINRRVIDYLKKEARYEISIRARKKAEQIGKKIKAIRIGDTSSRWGSCSSKAVLSFSWRLIMTAEDKLDYVVAHEVAHLKYMNHSQKFWDLCGELTDADVKECRNWFRKKGADLFNYG